MKSWISEDKLDFKKIKRVSRCCGAENLSTGSSKEYQETITVKKKQANISFFTKSK